MRNISKKSEKNLKWLLNILGYFGKITYRNKSMFLTAYTGEESKIKECRVIWLMYHLIILLQKSSFEMMR